MPLIRSFSELGQYRQHSVLTQARARELFQAQEQAHFERKFVNRPGHGHPIIAEATLRMANRPCDLRNEPATAGLEFDPRIRCYVRKPRPESRPGPPRKSYQPVSEPGALETWGIYDKATGARLWTIAGSYRHVVREGARAYGSRKDFYVKRSHQLSRVLRTGQFTSNRR